MASIFTKIIQGEIPGQVVWSDEVCAAFLDVSPLTRGHALVVPREVARQIEWQLSDQRTASLNSDLGIRACSAEVAYGMAPEVLGEFRIRYTVSRTDGGHASVELMD